MGGALLTRLNVICSWLSPSTFTVNSLIMCASMSFKKDLKNLLPVLVLSVDVVTEEVEHVPSIGATP